MKRNETLTNPPRKHPRSARVTSDGELGTMSKNNLRGITLGIRSIWGIHSLTLIISWFTRFWPRETSRMQKTLRSHGSACCTSKYRPVHTTPEEFENGGFTLKPHQMFSVHTTGEEFENGGLTLKTHQMFSVQATPEEFENGGFTLKTHQMFSVHTTPEEFENATITGYFGFVFEETREGKSRDYREVIVSGKLRFQNVFLPTRKRKAGIFKFLHFEERYRKAPF